MGASRVTLVGLLALQASCGGSHPSIATAPTLPERDGPALPAHATRGATLHFDAPDGSRVASPWVWATIHGQRFAITVDTGSGRTLLVGDAARAAIVPGSPLAYASDASGARHEGHVIPGASLVLDGWGPADAAYVVAVPDAGSPLLEPGGLQGVLAPQSLAAAGEAIVLDFPEHAMYAMPAHDAESYALRRAHALVTHAAQIELPADGNATYQIPAEIDDQATILLVDSGADATVIGSNNPVATALAARATQPRTSRLMFSTVVARAVENARVRAGDFEAAGHVELLADGAVLPEGLQGVLGMDRLARCTLALRAEAIVGSCGDPTDALDRRPPPPAMVHRSSGDSAAEAARNVSSLEQQCEAGSAAACSTVGQLSAIGRGVPRDLPRAARYLTRACDGGLIDACVPLGALLLAGGDGVPADRPRALALFTRGCDAGSLAGCVNIAIYDRQAGNAAPGVPLLVRACDGGLASGCNALGEAYRDAAGVAVDLAKAATLFERACFAGGDDFEGVGHGCANLGAAIVRGAGVAVDLPRSVELYRRACDRGDAYGCYGLGFAFSRGRGVAVDLATAVGHFQRACDGGFGHACAELASAYAQGHGVAADPARAAQAHQLACAARDQPICPAQPKGSAVAPPH